jgi:hypothetical protein
MLIAEPAAPCAKYAPALNDATWPTLPDVTLVHPLIRCRKVAELGCKSLREHHQLHSIQALRCLPACWHRTQRNSRASWGSEITCPIMRLVATEVCSCG